MKQAIWNEKVIAESDETTVIEGNHYFPSNCIKKDFFKSNDTQSVCPWKGTAFYYDVVVVGEINKDAAWYYPDASEMSKNIKGYVAFLNGIEIK